MIAFIVVACLMLLAALCFVLVPLARSSVPAATAETGRLSDSISNVAVFRSQRREVEDDFARGSISAEERDVALNELSQRLVDEVPADAAAAGVPAPSRPQQRPWLLMGALGIVIPAASFMVYATLGSPQSMRAGGPVMAGGTAEMAPHATGGGAPGGEAAGSEAAISDKQIVAMVDTLAKKMEANPGDPKGWVLLARSQGALGRYAEAVAAYERAAKLLPDDAQLFADYADVVVMSQDGRFEGKPMALIQKSLKLDPNNPKALALAGTAELRSGNREASLKHWEKLKTLVAKDSDDSRQVDAIIAEVKTGKPQAAPEAPANAEHDAIPVRPAASAPPPVVPAPAMTASAPAVASAPAAAAKPGLSVTGQVTLPAEMMAKLTPTDILYVFARAKEGPRMPLAALRIPSPKAGDFPKSFELTDAMAMSPGLNLSSFPEVVIEARISRSGNAQLQPGDLSGVSDPVKPGARAVKVNISRVVP